MTFDYGSPPARKAGPRNSHTGCGEDQVLSEPERGVIEGGINNVLQSRLRTLPGVIVSVHESKSEESKWCGSCLIGQENSHVRETGAWNLNPPAETLARRQSIKIAMCSGERQEYVFRRGNPEAALNSSLEGNRFG
jgi:hypothetical protein